MIGATSLRARALLASAVVLVLATTVGAQIQTGGKGGTGLPGGGTGGGRSRAMESDALMRHVVERLTFGVDDEMMRAIRELGVDGFIQWQLEPNRIAESPTLVAKLAALPPPYTAVGDYNWTWPSLLSEYFLRARYTPRQLNQVMTEFWRNHFNTALDYQGGGRVGYYASLVYDALDRPSVSYFNAANLVPWNATWTGSAWNLVWVDTSHPNGLYQSLAIDPVSRNKAMAYYQPPWGGGRVTGALRLSRHDGASWTNETVDTVGDVGMWASLGFTSTGLARIAYHDLTNGAVKLARHDGSTWSFVTVDTGEVGLSASLAIDASNREAIAYYDRDDQLVRFARWDGSAWQKSIVGPLSAVGLELDDVYDAPRLLSLAIDPVSGRPHVAYYDSAARNLVVASFDGVSWARTVVDASVDAGLFPSLVFHPTTRLPFVAYHERTNYDLKLARFDGGNWTTETAVASPHITGLWSSLAFDAAGNPSVAYFDGSDFSIYLAAKTTSWSVQLVDRVAGWKVRNTGWQRDVVESFRTDALGCFRDLLWATAESPAMMLYLNNNENFAGRGNENYARELLELHSVGVDGGYTQTDVETAARALTGWGIVETSPRCDIVSRGFCYNHSAHDGSAKTVFGLDLPPDSSSAPSDWMMQGTLLVDYLAEHPMTARFICQKLIQKFVADSPPARLWDACSSTFLRHGGEIRPVLETIFYSSEFRDPVNFRNKVKSPVESTVGVVRALRGDTDGVSLDDPTYYQGVPVFFEPVPTGYAEIGAQWANPNSLLQRWRFADVLLNGGLNGTTVDVQALVAETGLDRADAIVAWLCRRLIARDATPAESVALLGLLNGGSPGPVDLGDPLLVARLNVTVEAILGFLEFQKQ